MTTTTALATGRSKTAECLARWLLMRTIASMARKMPLTHEFLGLMLGTHRPGVTFALQALEERPDHRAAPQSHHLDRRALEKTSNGTYVTPEG